MESNVNNSPAGKDIRCADCRKSYRNCDCKSCSKCGCSYRKYAGTSLVKGRSHCRSCRSAVCLTCYVLVQGKKICTRCHLRQKEDEMNTEKALIAIEEAKYGKSDDQSLYSRLMHGERRETILFEAAKNGDDHVLVIALNMGADVNVTDNNKNTPLFHAAEGGRLACCALLLDRKADVNTVNNSGWTPLHAVAWKGSSDNHVECADLLLEAGADALAETSTNETAADVAERCGGKKEIIEILRAAEVEVTVLRLREKIKSLQGLNAKDRKLWRMITCLLNYTCKVQQNEIETVTGDIKNKRLALPCEPLLRCSSLDRDFGKKALCEKCGGTTMLSPKKQSQPFNDMSRPTADVEPMVRSMSLLHEVDGERSAVDTLDSASLRDRLVKLEAEKKDWEQRCRKLMQSVATNSKEHLRAMDLAKEEILRLKEEKEVELRKCEAAYANKLAKVRQEADTTIWEYHKQLEEAELVKDELTHLQKFHKLTWVPDYFVKSCQNPKCRSPFTQTNRKHHCRCCGRVYCHSCSSRKLTITSLGYDSPVRVCSSCFALVEDFFIDAEDAKIKLEANPVK